MTEKHLQRIIHKDGETNRVIYGYIDREDDNYLYVIRESDGKHFRFNHNAIVRIEDIKEVNHDPALQS